MGRPLHADTGQWERGWDVQPLPDTRLMATQLLFYVVCTTTLEEGMATYSSILAWRMPWTEEPGRL